MTVRKLPSNVVHPLQAARDKVVCRLNSKYRAISVGAANSLCDRARLVGLQAVADRVARQHLPGNVVECGVYRGGSAVVLAERLLGSNCEQSEMHLFDIFSGMPKPGPEDPPEAWEDVGKFVSSAAIVQENFAMARIPFERIHIFTGSYDITLPAYKPSPIIFLHLDCDWYASVKLCLHMLYNAVVSGGAVVFDDYGYWSGCRKAVDEFLVERSLDISLTPIDSSSHYFFNP